MVEIYLALMLLVCVDYVTGIIGALVTQSFSSCNMRIGLLHKITYVFAIVTANLVSYFAGYFELGIVTPELLETLVITWIVITELGSILENLVKINPALADNSFMRIFSSEKKEGGQ